MEWEKGRGYFLTEISNHFNASWFEVFLRTLQDTYPSVLGHSKNNVKYFPKNLQTSVYIKIL